MAWLLLKQKTEYFEWSSDDCLGLRILKKSNSSQTTGLHNPTVDTTCSRGWRCTSNCYPNPIWSKTHVWERMTMKRTECILVRCVAPCKDRQFRLLSKHFKTHRSPTSPGTDHFWNARFNDLIMVAMLSNLAHTFEVGGQSAFWMQERSRKFRPRLPLLHCQTNINKCHYRIFHYFTGWLSIVLRVNASRDPHRRWWQALYYYYCIAQRPSTTGQQRVWTLLQWVAACKLSQWNRPKSSMLGRTTM